MFLMNLRPPKDRAMREPTVFFLALEKKRVNLETICIGIEPTQYLSVPLSLLATKPVFNGFFEPI